MEPASVVQINEDSEFDCIKKFKVRVSFESRILRERNLYEWFQWHLRKRIHVPLKAILNLFEWHYAI